MEDNMKYSYDYDGECIKTLQIYNSNSPDVFSEVKSVRCKHCHFEKSRSDKNFWAKVKYHFEKSRKHRQNVLLERTCGRRGFDII